MDAGRPATAQKERTQRDREKKVAASHRRNQKLQSSCKFAGRP